MAKIRSVIESSMRLIGVIAQGETPSAQNATDALEALKSMLESWSLERLTIPVRKRRVFPLVSGKASYTIGPGGDFDISRPVSIDNAGLVVETGANEAEYPIRILSPQEWEGILQKNMQADLPTKLYVDGSSPLDTVTLWPVPAVVNDVALYCREPLETNLTLNDDFEFPIGYYQAIRYSLALELAAEFEREPSALVVSKAATALANIKRQNIRDELMSVDPGLQARSRFNIYTGDT